ncbi:MAG TPA: L-lactate permease, partial [Thermoanaerobaculia bacterium]|nr:L-lactate permease [Thermoanaerobaculia bacterium]
MNLSGSDLIKIYTLLTDLRQQGFAIGIDHHVRIERLLGQTGEIHSSAELMTLLCPLFATDRKQQLAFYETFDRLFAVPVEVVTPEPRPAENVQARPRISRRIWALISALLLAGLAAYLTVRILSAPAPIPIPAPSQLPAQIPPDSATPGKQPTTTHYARQVVISALGFLLSLLLFQQWLRYRKQSLVLVRARHRKPPFSWPIKTPAPEVRDFRSDLFFRAARLLRRRRVSEAQRLDIPQTIAATIEACGLPTLRVRPDSEFPEYLALIERASYRDHQALLFDRLAKALEAEGVFLVSYFYNGDPRSCQPRDGSSTIRLHELQKRYSEHRLLLFTAGEELIDPISGGFASWVPMLFDWRERAILTPKDERAWGFRERTLEEGFIVLPATVQGLGELADRLELPAQATRDESNRAGLPPSRSAAGPAVSVDELPSHLGEIGFQWLCACAVYPELHWDMTLYLGALPSLGDGSLREELLLRLARLPWFRRGTLPDDLRLRLIERLDPTREQEVRRAVVELLSNNPARPGSFAASSRELQVLAQDAYLARNEPKSFRRVLRRLRAFPQSDIVADRPLLRLMREARVSRLAIAVPSGVRKTLFNRGVSAFGLRWAATAIGALVLAIALVWASLGGSPTPRAIVLGRVTDIQGAPISGAEVRLYDARGLSGVISITDAAGRFRIALPSAVTTYRLFVDRPGLMGRFMGRVSLQTGKTSLVHVVVAPSGAPQATRMPVQAPSDTGSTSAGLLTWSQVYVPVGGSQYLSALVAALPYVVLLGLLGFAHLKAHWAALFGLATALAITILLYGMPAKLALAAAANGAAFGLLPVGWIVLTAMFFFDITVKSGTFAVLRRTIEVVTSDRRIQLLLVGFSFGAFLEGVAGFGTPIVICGAILIGLGFRPLQAAGLVLLCNTVPVAFGALGTPIITLAKVTGLPENQLSAMVGRQLPFFSLLVPLLLVWAMGGRRAVRELWPACVTCGLSYAIIQFFTSNYFGPTLVDTASSIVSVLALLILLRFWQPQTTSKVTGESARAPATQAAPRLEHVPATAFRALAPWILLCILLFAWAYPGFKDSLNGGA